MNSLKIDKKSLELARKQFCLDIGLPWEEYEREPNRLVYIRKAVYGEESKLRLIKQARNYEGREDFFHAIICLGQLFLAVDEQLYDWAKAQFENCAPEWFCAYGNLRRIDEMLRTYGYQIKDTHVYFLPESKEFVQKEEIAQSLEQPAFQWYDQEEILKFQEGNRFTSAICFSKTQPDMLAVASYKDGGTSCVEKPFDQSRMTGMAGVSADGEYLWQIGINVDEALRGQGLASKLVKCMKERVQAMGKVPFYGTSESHNISKTVGLKAGFVPAWTEVYVK